MSSLNPSRDEGTGILVLDSVKSSYESVFDLYVFKKK
jgi:hypothetical protein